MERSNGMRLIEGAKRPEAGRSDVELHGVAGWLWGLVRSRRHLRDTPRKQMRLIETLPLGGKRQLMLVRCGEESFLIGCSVESVTTIVPVRAVATQASTKGADETCQ
ncbi:flagellar biosynthetic protein FliO [Edaphobacter sp.]|uniref:flagellar biosynthetic protein FliO n=1 Tax=Edaphobacter sp. TaxID=1934404 RepID=UPI002DB86C2B|nr:flagellar biosynthetic protein FliO [Edaphobacter sp.]HEU5342638.1 flagellar biosynthetic protein FliO [Edaphobacter sp.]